MSKFQTLKQKDVHNKLTPNKRELKRISWNIVKKLLKLLYYNGRMKKTHIATKCNLSYDKCRLYLDWMDMMDLIKRETDGGGFEIISLNEKGSDIYTKKFKHTAKF